jgi:hypothetical protein
MEHIKFVLVHVWDIFRRLLREFSHKGSYMLVVIHNIRKHTAQIDAGNYTQVLVYQYTYIWL